MTLRECIASAEERKTAIGHFNIATLEMFWGVVRAAKAVNVPVVIGVSEGERAFMGLRQVVALARSLGDAYPPVFVNADHTYSIEKAREAIDARYDSVIADGAKLPWNDNVSSTKAAVTYARGAGVLIEGELGYIGEGSRIHDTMPEGAAVVLDAMTTPDDAERFVAETGIDLLAPAVGNIHGMVKEGNPHLNISRIQDVRAAAGVPLVLHGGSGVSDGDLRAAITAGISVVHVSTELRVAYKKSLRAVLTEEDAELAPYKYLDAVVAAVEKSATRILRSGA